MSWKLKEFLIVLFLHGMKWTGRKEHNSRLKHFNFKWFFRWFVCQKILWAARHFNIQYTCVKLLLWLIHGPDERFWSVTLKTFQQPWANTRRGVTMFSMLRFIKWTLCVTFRSWQSHWTLMLRQQFCVVYSFWKPEGTYLIVFYWGLPGAFEGIMNC